MNSYKKNILFCTLFSIGTLFAQNKDPQAKQLLNQVNKKIESY
jgi:hypothetical protein